MAEYGRERRQFRGNRRHLTDFARDKVIDAGYQRGVVRVSFQCVPVCRGHRFGTGESGNVKERDSPRRHRHYDVGGADDLVGVANPLLARPIADFVIGVARVVADLARAIPRGLACADDDQGNSRSSPRSGRPGWRHGRREGQVGTRMRSDSPEDGGQG